MSIEISLNTPLAEALTRVIQPKLMEVGWAQSNDDAALSEYVILMLVNGKTQEQIASELAGDLLSLGPDDPAARDFTHWLFDQINTLQLQISASTSQAGASIAGLPVAAMEQEQDTEMSTSTDGPELNAPTGPRSMRNGNMRGGREKRMFGQMAKAMDRSHDSVLHRVRVNGNERINAHNRGPPTGSRGGRGNNRAPFNRNAGMNAGLNQMASVMSGMPTPPGMNAMNDMNWMMPGGAQQEQIFNLLQQQNHMMAQLQQQLAQQNQGGGNGRPGRSLYDRVQNPRGGRRGGGHHTNGPRAQQTGSPKPTEVKMEGEDVDMTQARSEPPNPEITVCKFNLACTNKDCKFAHQSPAAPPNTTVDLNDVCSFGAACKNWKCVGRHPSPATKRAHQNEQECKFYPNCTNPHCPFKHPDMPPCRNGGDCNVEGCKFTHLQTMCKFKPCKNRYCPFKHEEGQRGTFPDKVWTADSTQNHVSERHFVNQNATEEFIIPGADDDSEDAFIALLRTVYLNGRHSAVCQPGSAARHLSTSSRSRTRTQLLRPTAPAKAKAKADREPREIAILGAGITGLTAAHYLARYSKANITIYEADSRPGGWIKADRVEVEDNEGRRGHVMFQSGPRMLRSSATSLRYDDLVLFDVLVSLDMTRKVIAPQMASGTRYLYYPDHLVKMPSGMRSLSDVLEALHSFITEPIYSGALRAAFKAVLHLAHARDTAIENDQEQIRERFSRLPEDESVAHFLKRFLGDDRIPNNIVSGVLHGIYGGDINKLSVKHTILESLWRRLKNVVDSDLRWISIGESFLLSDMLSSRNRLEIIRIADRALDWPLLAFEDGLVPLVNGLVEDLKKKKNVTFRYGEPVTSLKNENGKTWMKRPTGYDHVISTLFSKQLAQITEPPGALPSLAETHAVTIMAVNLWYPNPDLLTHHGFGYLVPSTTPDNDECVLGVLFDSDLHTGGNEMPGTKLTVMLGGHHWDGWQHLPSEEMGIAMAKEAVRRQLGISEDEKVVARARLCRECLPQHYVGHRERMRSAHYQLMEAFKGQLSVAGPSYTPVGVLPAMRAGYDAAMSVAFRRPQPWFRVPAASQQADANGKQPRDLDYWEAVLERVEEPALNTTGLQQFTDDEWHTMEPLSPSALLLRAFTAPELRFRDGDGNFIDPSRRHFANYPMDREGIEGSILSWQQQKKRK
ncbi:hypothetical protein F4777DRAFT_586446 [Nemania sp. FL0916]|nr:hypothetical protein F4777DRAFT_586446 [Nemania sp. FL0916]